MRSRLRGFVMRSRFRRFIMFAVASLLAISVVIGIVLAFNWPFTRTEFVRSMEHFSSCEVKVRRFQHRYFPHPGYVAEDVVFQRRSNGRAIEMASVKKIDCLASWAALMTFTHRVNTFRIEGLHVSIPAPVPAAMPFYPSMKERTTVTTLIADGAVLEIAPRRPDGRPVRFDFTKLRLGEVKKEKSISLDTMLHNPEPPGEIAVRGRFGPFEKGHLASMPLSGSFDLIRADLGHTQAISGMLTSHGSFQGLLSRCDVRGNARVDGFAIKKVRHPMQLDGNFDTTVDGLHGDVSIHSTKVRFLRTELQASGGIRTAKGEEGKTESLDITGTHARLEDLLRLFAKSDPPAVSGPIQFHAKVLLPPRPEKFLRKLQLKGGFQISEAEFLHTRTQQKVDKLSERARGRKVEKDAPAEDTVRSSLGAQVDLRNGTAMLSDATFKTHGATASGQGTYNLLTEEINLRGKLAIEASLSKAAGGIKSVLLIPLDPFFKKEHAGAVLPIHVGGTYSHPSFRVSLTGSK